MHVMAHLKAFIILKANLTSDFAVFHFFSSVIEKLDMCQNFEESKGW